MRSLLPLYHFLIAVRILSTGHLPLVQVIEQGRGTGRGFKILQRPIRDGYRRKFHQKAGRDILGHDLLNAVDGIKPFLIIERCGNDIPEVI